jgi:hypothetical protein
MARTLPDPQDIWTPDDARRLLDEWRRVGGPLSAFARSHGCSPRRLYWWKRQLSHAGAANEAVVSLVAATVIGTQGGPAPVTIRLPTGIAIEASDATPTWIAAVVLELTRSR